MLEKDRLNSSYTDANTTSSSAAAADLAREKAKNPQIYIIR